MECISPTTGGNKESICISTVLSFLYVSVKIHPPNVKSISVYFCDLFPCMWEFITNHHGDIDIEKVRCALKS